MGDQKTIGLTRPAQIDAYENAKKAAVARLEGDPTEGEVVQELAEAYTGDYEYEVATATDLLDEEEPIEALDGAEEMNAERSVGEDDEGPTRPPLLLRLASGIGRRLVP